MDRATSLAVDNWPVPLQDALKGKAVDFEGLCRRRGVHPVHLAARFRAHYGATVGEQIRALRVRHAMTCLQETKRPISEISLEAGFSDQSHLSRVVR